jgi:3-deoxy-D-arabino-heptulosonate 7-phosphate (DAHP) synthase class II
MKNDELTELVQILNPNKEEGKLVLITRYGHDKIDGLLPGHIEAVKASGVPVVWQCDGVHGNTVTAKSVSAHSHTRPPARPPARPPGRPPPNPLPPLACRRWA